MTKREEHDEGEELLHTHRLVMVRKYLSSSRLRVVKVPVLRMVFA